MSDRLFWMENDNFGDVLNPYLYEHITGRTASVVSATDPDPKLIMIGSVLNHATDNATVWGAGLAWENDRVNANCDIRAVRGPLTREIALRSGVHCPEVYGDPALLLPRYYKPERTDEHLLGVIPHFLEYGQIVSRGWDRQYDGIHIIDLTKPVETVIDEMNQCEHIISSSLHGLIVADAYDIPTHWVEFDEKIGGDYTKFFDYFDSVGIKRYHPFRFQMSDLGSFDMRLATRSNIRIDLEKLMDTFPWELVG